MKWQDESWDLLFMEEEVLVRKMDFYFDQAEQQSTMAEDYNFAVFTLSELARGEFTEEAFEDMEATEKLLNHLLGEIVQKEKVGGEWRYTFSDGSFVLSDVKYKLKLG